MKLTDLLAASPFALFGVHPRDWDGPAFAGDAVRDAGVLRSVQLVYLDAIDGSSLGACVSNLGTGGAAIDPVGTHVVDFVARFQPDFLLGKMKRRRFEPFPPGVFAERPVTVAVAGHTLGGIVYTHRELPLQLLRVAIRRGDAVTDLGVATWRLAAMDLAAKVQPVDVRFAKEFDAADETGYPIPDIT